MVQASADEQYMLELVNTARAAAGVQPLAMNGLINDAADLHTKYQLDIDQMTHTGAGGTNAQQRMAAAGYSFTGSTTWGENVGWQSVSGSTSYQDEVAGIHDWLMNSPGHRANILNESFREIGIGIIGGEFQGWNAVYATQKFAKSGTSVFLTGVAFDDKDGDRRYDVGEGLGSATITAVNSTTGATFSAATGAAGGYSLALPAGTYRYSFAGSGFATMTGTVTIGTSNVKLDWVDPATSATTTAPPPSSGMTLTGTAGADTLTGGADADVLHGLEGSDTLNGGAGADRMVGGSGNDSYTVDNSGDVVTEYASEGADIVRSSIAYDLPINVENLTLTGTSALSGTGNALANVIKGNAAANVLKGLSGNDKLYGHAGNDRLEGGDGNDFLQSGSGTDTLVGGAGTDSFDWNSAGDAGKGTTRDVVLDFTRGTDKLDLSGIDANSGTTTNDAFSFVGSQAFSGTAGQLRFYEGGGYAIVQGDVNGDKIADFELKLEGVTALGSSDFWL